VKSNVYVTYQIDDLDDAVKEITAGIFNGFTLLRNSVGLLFCYSDMDSDVLAEKLSEKAGFDVIGCTCIANMENRDGFHNIAATFLVMTADDCEFAVAQTEKIQPGSVHQLMEKAYGEACAKLTDEPKLIFGLPPYILEIMLDEYTNGFNAIAPGVPVVGGLPSYNANGDRNLVFCNGQASDDRMVMLVISGNINPVFSVQNVASMDASRKRKVTKAVNNVIYEVGGQRFTDYLKEIGLPVESLTQGNTTVTFVSNPILLENHSAEAGQDFSFVRTLHEVNLEEGSGTAIGEVPVGATLSICTLEREEIERKALEGIRDINNQMKASEKPGYTYSTVLAISCIGRHLLMLPENDAEVNQILKEFPSEMTMAGFYSYGEIGPQGSVKNHNFAHNESLILCGF